MQESTEIDAKIVHFLQNGDMNKGFKLLIESYQQRLYWHIRGIVKNHDDTNDVIQNTFVKIYKGIHGFKSEAQLYTWLYRIATNESLTFLRKRKTTDTMDDINFRQEAAPHHDEKTTLEYLSLALEQLPEKQCIVFNLRYFEELSYADISKITGTSVGGLKANYHHAIKKLIVYLKEKNIH